MAHRVASAILFLEAGMVMGGALRADTVFLSGGGGQRGALIREDGTSVTLRRHRRLLIFKKADLIRRESRAEKGEKITLLFTNDLGGDWEDEAYRRRLELLARRVTEIAREDPRCLVVDAGGALPPGGDPEARREMVRWLNRLGVAAKGVGETELEQGWEAWQKLRGEAEFPCLMGNACGEVSGRPLMDGYTRLERGPLRIGILAGRSARLSLPRVEGEPVIWKEPVTSLPGECERRFPEVEVLVVLFWGPLAVKQQLARELHSRATVFLTGGGPVSWPWAFREGYLLWGESLPGAKGFGLLRLEVGSESGEILGHSYEIVDPEKPAPEKPAPEKKTPEPSPAGKQGPQVRQLLE